MKLLSRGVTLRHVFAVVAVISIGQLTAALTYTNEVHTNYGRVRGVQMPGNDGDAYEAFLGIPFASPPTGALRFANPQNPIGWRGVRDCITPKPDCIQKNSLLPHPSVTGSEDCLYLNLYRPLLQPRNTSSNDLPVIVFIHGGAFFSGSPSPTVLGPQYFMNTGKVIFVAMAYRLGALGFLSTGDAYAPGNVGLKDQTMALKWVKQNIKRFGGNASEVTIMGVSAGAASVHLHMMSPLSKNLFQRGVSLSGNALGPYTIPTKNPLKIALRQADLLEIHASNNRDLVAKLQAVPAEMLVNSIDKMKFWSVDPLTLYRLVIESSGSNGAFLTSDPSEISRNGSYEQVPWIQGSVQNEGAIRAAPILSNQTLLSELNLRLDELLPQLMELSATETNSMAIINEKIKRRYLKSANAITEENRQGFINLYSDRSFLYPLYTSIYDYVRTARPAPVYVYKFNFKGPISFSALLTNTNTDYGVVHLDDTIYLFQTAFWPPFDSASPFAHMTRTLVQFYVDFAVTGQPTNLGVLTPCTSDAIKGGMFCEYFDFRNSNTADGYAINVDNDFDISMIDFWSDILNVPGPELK